MPIINNKKNINIKKPMVAKIDSELLVQIDEYCQWAGIYDLGYFIEKAADYIFLKDEEWKSRDIEIKNNIP